MWQVALDDGPQRRLGVTALATVRALSVVALQPRIDILL